MTPAVVTITTPTGTGSGVVVSSSGTIVSSLHVVRGDETASIRLANGDVYDDVQVLDVDARKDLVVLKIKAFGITAATIGDSDSVAVGDTVYVVGSPRGLQNTVTNGLISATRDSGEGYRIFQTSAAASPGSSGGGMFNEYGELVGIVSSKVMNAENVNFAVPSNYARGLLTAQSPMTLAELARRYPAVEAGTGVTPTQSERVITSPASRAKLAQAVKDSGLSYEPSGEGWVTEFDGKNTQTMKVYVFVYEDMAEIQSMTVWSRALTAPQMEKLLTENFSNDFVKLGLSENKLHASAEADLRTLDGPLLKRLVNLVAVAADDAFGILDGTLEATYGDLDGSGSPLPTTATSVVEFNANRMAIRYDNRQWKRDGRPEDMQFIHSSGEVWFRVIAERAEIPLAGMEQVVLTNMKQVAPDAKVLRRGFRTINGKRVLVLEIQTTVSALPIRFYGHYFSNDGGTIQIVAWTAANLIEEKRAVIDQLVSGFTAR